MITAGKAQGTRCWGRDRAQACDTAGKGASTGGG